MTAPTDNAETLLAVVHEHLEAATAALATDSSPAAALARREIEAAIEAHEHHTRKLSHDLRNALTAISGQTQLLSRQLNRAGSESVETERVRRALNRVSTATNDATEVSRQLTGK